MIRLHDLLVLGAALVMGMLLYSGISHANQPTADQVPSPNQADAIIQSASPEVTAQLLGPFQPSNQLEKDILATALLDIENRQLVQAALAGDQAARARRLEIYNLITAYQKQYADSNFNFQWWVVSGRVKSAPVENLIPSVRALYEAKYGASGSAAEQQVAQTPADHQPAAPQARQRNESQVRTVDQASVGCAPAADGTRFDPQDIDKALSWWIARTREMGEAQRSGNQLRIDAAKQQFERHLACLVNQRIKYTFRTQKHPIRDDPVISAQGVLIGIYHKSDYGVISVGAERDSRGITHAQSAPILLRANRDIDAGVLPNLSTSSTFLASGRIAKTSVLGATSLRPPTLILFVSDVQVEQVRP